MIDPEPQGLFRAPKTFEQTLVFGKESLAALAEMIGPARKYGEREALFRTAQVLQREKYDAAIATERARAEK